jgi:hypothetical protein
MAEELENNYYLSTSSSLICWKETECMQFPGRKNKRQKKDISFRMLVYVIGLNIEKWTTWYQTSKEIVYGSLRTDL